MCNHVSKHGKILLFSSFLENEFCWFDYIYRVLAFANIPCATRQESVAVSTYERRI